MDTSSNIRSSRTKVKRYSNEKKTTQGNYECSVAEEGLADRCHPSETGLPRNASSVKSAQDSLRKRSNNISFQKGPVCVCHKNLLPDVKTEENLQKAKQNVDSVRIDYQPSTSSTQICETYKVPIDLGNKPSDTHIMENLGINKSLEDLQPSSGSRSKCDDINQNSSCSCKSSMTPPRKEDDPKFDMARSSNVTQTVKSASEKAACSQKCRKLTPMEWQGLQFRKLVRDNYCPGTLQDAAEGNINYNALVLSLMKETFGSITKDPGPYTPMSLLEAFNRRIKSERVEVKHFLVNQKSTSGTEIESYFQQKIPNNTNRAIMYFLKAENLFQNVQPEPAPDYDFNVTSMELNLPNCLTTTVYMGRIFPH